MSQKFMGRIWGRWQKLEALGICFPICITITVAEYVWYNNFGTLESIEGFQGEGLDSKLRLFQSVLALGTTAVIHSPSLSLMTGACAGLPRAACTQLAGTRVGKNDPVLQISEICALIRLLLLITEVQTNRQAAITLIYPSIITTPPQLKWFLKDLKVQCPFFFFFLVPPSFFSFSPFRSQTLKTKTFRNNCKHMGGNYKVPMHAQRKVQIRLEKTLYSRLRQHRDTLQ